jgi:phage tail-like protein
MIDVNRQTFFMLTGANAFDLTGAGHTAEWNDARGVLRLKSTRTLSGLPTDRTRAKTLSEQPPATLDAFGTWARPDTSGRIILAGGVFPDPIEILTLPDGEQIVDMAMNPEGILYAISRDAGGVSTVWMINRKGDPGDGKNAFLGDEDEDRGNSVSKARFPDGGPQPDRIVPLDGGGALLLDRSHKIFWQVVGKPVRSQPTAMYPPTTPRPCMEGPRPQELIQRPDLGLPGGFEAVAMASGPNGHTAILLFPDDPAQPAAVVLISGKTVSAPVFLEGARAPFSIGPVCGDEWAVLFDGRNEAFVYAVPFLPESPADPSTVSGRRYPLNRGTDSGLLNTPLCNGLSEPAYYPSTDTAGRFMIRPLAALSYPSYATGAVAAASSVIDSGEPNTVWHRLFLEARLPKGTGVIVRLASGEERDAVENATEWYEHRFGALPESPDTPMGSWIRESSEVPYFKGLLSCPPESGLSGVFGVLIQRAGRVVRTMKGRYLNVTVELVGGGHATPEIAAIRVVHPRFSYLDRYLPELYRETTLRTRADETGPASGPDFLQRFLCLFESVLTPLEDKVALSHVVTNPMSAPSDALDWLGRWIGVTDLDHLTELQKRRYIRSATAIYRKRGTLKGLSMVLDLVFDNAACRGDIVLLEDFRLRRTFATILGADFSVEDDPLLMDDIPIANSYVGDTLFLGEEEKKEFLALYAGEIPLTADEQETVDNFYARLANRLTVLVHNDADPETLSLIGRVVGAEVPAHIDIRVVPASKPLLIGLYAILGVDTYMRKEPERGTARIGYSTLGRNDFIRKLPALDGRLEP